MAQSAGVEIEHEANKPEEPSDEGDSAPGMPGAPVCEYEDS